MRKIKQEIFFLFLITLSSSIMIGSGSISKGFDIKTRFSSVGDTSLINKYTRLALKYMAKKGDFKSMKTYIDTAEMMCQKENVEMPALLHLARAQYFYFLGDFNNSSMEATIALKLSENNSDPKMLAKTMIFLGKYNLRTGFIKESIDYFNNVIALATKKRLKGFIPLGYNALTNVYYNVGKTKEYNKCLQKLIEASRAENDTIYLQTGYYYLGSSLTGENRNYRKADSLEFQDYKVPDSLVFRNFKKADSLLRISLEISLKKRDTTYISLSLANLGWNFRARQKLPLLGSKRK